MAALYRCFVLMLRLPISNGFFQAIHIGWGKLNRAVKPAWARRFQGTVLLPRALGLGVSAAAHPMKPRSQSRCLLALEALTMPVSYCRMKSAADRIAGFRATVH